MFSTRAFRSLYSKSLLSPNAKKGFSSALHSQEPPSILVTGALGQLGSGLIPFIQAQLGPDAHIVATDIRKKSSLTSVFRDVTYLYADVASYSSLETIIVQHGINTVIHLSALLSAIGESEPQRALEVNLNAVHSILELARIHRLKLLIPSTIGAFGPSTPKVCTPDTTIMRPTTIYGITKLHMELMGEYYQRRYGVDFRSLRLPGVLSTDTPPGGGTTDYAIHMLQWAVQGKKEPYVCFLSEHTRLPMMHANDTFQGMYRLLFEASEADLTQRVYNVGAMDFTPGEMAAKIQQLVPSFKVVYQPDHRQAIADSWPASLDDSVARKDWHWNPKYSLDDIINALLSGKK